MKIAIDCRSLRKKPAGVANFLIGVINHLAILQKEWQIYLLSNEDFSEETKKKLSSAANIIKVIEPLPFLSNIATIWYLLKVTAILKKLSIDLIYCPIPNLPFFIPANVKTLITVHDMVYRRFPETMSIGNRMINFCLHDYSINTADRLWAVSHYTKSEIESIYPFRKCKKIEVGTSIDKSIFYPRKLALTETDAVLKKYHIESKFILTVGTLEPRKNLQFLLSLMPALAVENLQLIIVGMKGWGNTMQNLPDLTDVPGNKIRFAGFVPDEDLIRLYHLASVYVCTSLNEGFCLPLLEAMQCGCPVVTAHNSGMIEVAQGGGQTVSGWDKNVWIETIRQTIANRSKYVEAGFMKAAAYEWSEVVGRIISYVKEG